MKTNRELDELIYKLFHNVDEIPPPQGYVDFSSRSVEYVDQIPNYTESVDNALTLLDGKLVSVVAFGLVEKSEILCTCCINDVSAPTSSCLAATAETLAMAICLAWLNWKGYSNAREN